MINGTGHRPEGIRAERARETIEFEILEVGHSRAGTSALVPLAAWIGRSTQTLHLLASVL